MSKLSLRNALAAEPSIAIEAMGLAAVSITVEDGLGGVVNLRVPRSQAKVIANKLNGTANAQIREELERAEAAGSITDVQARRLKKIRDAAQRTAEMNAQRSADAAARKTGKVAKLKAVG